MAEQQTLVPPRRRSVNARVFSHRTVGVVAAGGLLAILGGTTLGLALGIPVVFLASGGAVITAKRTARRFSIDNQLASDALNSGEFGKANEIWSYWVDVRDNRQIRLTARHNLAHTWMCQGKLEAARKLHQENSEHLNSLQRLGLTQLSAVCVGYCHALLGELDAATKWLAIARSRDQQPQVASTQPMMVFVQVIVQMRRGHSDQAAKLIDDNWDMLEGRLVALHLRAYRLLRAFARSAAGPREAGRSQLDLDSLRPRYPGEHLYLAAEWPEIAVFLAANGLA